ncbi:MAG: futalosine hydrolase [Planctomycetota bacterium]
MGTSPIADDDAFEPLLLIAVAAPAEAEAVARALGMQAPGEPWQWTTSRDVVLLRTGVGKANAAAAVARCVASHGPMRVLLNIGVAGAYAGSGLEIGAVVLADRSVFADDGIETPNGFETQAEMGFPPVSAQPGRPLIDLGQAVALTELVREPLLGCGLVDAVGAVATVSTCSGTDTRACAVAERTGAIAEAMEGAACGLVAQHEGMGFAEVRIISNTTGNRDKQHWDLPRALDTLQRVTRPIAKALLERMLGISDATGRD